MNVLPTCSVYGFQMGMILLFFGGLEVEVVDCEYLGVQGEVCVGLRQGSQQTEKGCVMREKYSLG